MYGVACRSYSGPPPVRRLTMEVRFAMSPEKTIVLSDIDAGPYIGVSPKTLRNWRSRGEGPRYVRYSARCVRYRISGLDAYVDSRVVS